MALIGLLLGFLIFKYEIPKGIPIFVPTARKVADEREI
jgi:hypothetical protein